MWYRYYGQGQGIPIFSSGIEEGKCYTRAINQSLRMVSSGDKVIESTYEEFATDKNIAHCAFSAEIELNDSSREWNKDAFINLKYRGTHDPVFYEYLLSRSQKSIPSSFFVALLVLGLISIKKK